MKTLNNAQIIAIIEHCTDSIIEFDSSVCDACPLVDECLYYLTGDECGSALETKDGSETY